MKDKFSNTPMNIDGLPENKHAHTKKGKVKLLDVVTLTQDIPEHNLKRGEVGTVVEIFSDGEAFEVEFSDHNGQMYKSLSFPAAQITVFHHEPINTIRRTKLMKHIPYFQNFLANEVNLNETRLQTLNQRSLAVDTFLSSNLDAYEKTERQGSYGLKTIIKPVGTREYDADMLLYMTYDEDKEPKDYINEVYNCLKGNANYKDKVHRRTRCVYINYAGDFHLDLVPCITQEEEYFICNNKENEFEVTDGTGYRDWFNEKTRITNGNLKHVTRLLKFFRDHKGNFSVKSILLTTLIGNSVYASDEWGEDFKDIPTSLKTISNRINSFLQANVLMPEICNPVLEGESFTRHWDQDKYNHFREMLDLYNRKINEAFEETEHNASVRKWRQLFGDNFGELKVNAESKGGVPVIVAPGKPYAR